MRITKPRILGMAIMVCSLIAVGVAARTRDHLDIQGRLPGARLLKTYTQANVGTSALEWSVYEVPMNISDVRHAVADLIWEDKYVQTEDSYAFDSYRGFRVQIHSGKWESASRIPKDLRWCTIYVWHEVTTGLDKWLNARFPGWLEWRYGAPPIIEESKT